jgi:zinc protease
MAVVGDFDRKTILPKLKAFLTKIPKGKLPSRWDRDYCVSLPAEVGDYVEKQPREQAVVMQAFPGPRVHADDYYVGDVADELFSGMASRLFERVREEKGLAYFVRSGRVLGLDTGMFYFFAGTQPGREGDVLAEIDAEIARVQAGQVEEVELRRCQARLKAGQRQSMQTNSSRALQATLNVLQGQPVNAWRDYDRKIDAVTVKDLAVFAEKYFQRAQRTQLVVRP